MCIHIFVLPLNMLFAFCDVYTFCVSETKHFRHAFEVAADLDLEFQNGIVCVSGDGVLVEVIRNPNF